MLTQVHHSALVDKYTNTKTVHCIGSKAMAIFWFVGFSLLVEWHSGGSSINKTIPSSSFLRLLLRTLYSTLHTHSSSSSSLTLPLLHPYACLDYVDSCISCSSFSHPFAVFFLLFPLPPTSLSNTKSRGSLGKIWVSLSWPWEGPTVWGSRRGSTWAVGLSHCLWFCLALELN